MSFSWTLGEAMDLVGVGLIVPLLFFAFMVVVARDIVRSILWLGAVLGWTAALYASLQAGFIAGVQLLLYAGGVVTLMIVGIMVTARAGGVSADDRRGRPDLRALLTALLTFAVMAYAIHMTPFGGQRAPSDMTTRHIGEMLLGDHAIAFEVLSLLLLGGMLGAIVLTRRMPGKGVRS